MLSLWSLWPQLKDLYQHKRHGWRWSELGYLGYSSSSISRRALASSASPFTS
ncbi:hypothetical protein ZIOFF_051129 [Zingiber officinale]|uniref:Uncharacterized protein n=1 Tax=Zingiber officinale TaxID=94328 RepID=A0A8J5FM71_ZINOF|nr:hypothetical protein ZIOFF_051129 [Zingiber officinale]